MAARKVRSDFLTSPSNVPQAAELLWRSSSNSPSASIVALRRWAVSSSRTTKLLHRGRFAPRDSELSRVPAGRDRGGPTLACPPPPPRAPPLIHSTPPAAAAAGARGGVSRRRVALNRHGRAARPSGRCVPAANPGQQKKCQRRRPHSFARAAATDYKLAVRPFELS